MKKQTISIALAVVCGGAIAAPQYTVESLGKLNAADLHTAALGVNNLGDVVGYSGDVFGEGHAFLYSHATHAMTQIPFGNSDQLVSTAWAINDSGKVVGGMGVNVNDTAFISDGTTTTLIGGLAGATFNNGFAINNAGQVAGGSDSLAWRYTNGTFESMGHSGRDANIAAITADGRIIGWDSSAAWISDTGTTLKNFDLKGVVHGGNDAGTAVGTARISSVTRPNIWVGGVHTVLNGSWTPYDINNNGLIVGATLSGYDNTDGAAVVYDNNTQLFLDDLNLSSGWSLFTATSVNDKGQIVGQGMYNGQIVAYIATPVPEPATITLLGLGSLALIRRRRAK